jgi:hypothetical protein
MHERRASKQQEIEVIRAAIARARVQPVYSEDIVSLSDLIVAGQCNCGCASVDFEKREPERPSHRIADGIGTTPQGGCVGVIVWGQSDGVTGLEIYDLGAGDGNLVLPVPDSIEPWEGSVRPEK